MLKITFRPPTVKQFGLPRTGTNYCRFLLESNYQVRVLVDKEGWKHGHISPRLHPCRMCIMLVKDPFAWLVSALKLYRRYLFSTYSVATGSLDEFLESKFVIGDRGSLLSFDNPISCWNGMTRHWLSIPYTGRDLITVRYEDLLKDPPTTLEAIAKKFHLVKKIGDFEDTDQILRMASDEEPIINRGNTFDPAYYLDRQYMEAYTESQIDYIGNRLDKKLLDKLQYSE